MVIKNIPGIFPKGIHNPLCSYVSNSLNGFGRKKRHNFICVDRFGIFPIPTGKLFSKFRMFHPFPIKICFHIFFYATETASGCDYFPTGNNSEDIVICLVIMKNDMFHFSS